MPTALDNLIAGYQEFRSHYFNGTNIIFEKLVQFGQKPKVLIIACSDSRVDPAIVTNCQPGDLFVVRNVANLVPPYEHDNGYHGTSAALEFGVCGLEIQHIIVFGHTECGGIASLFAPNQGNMPSGFITKWMELAHRAHDFVMEHDADKPLEAKISLCSQLSLMNSLHNLRTFPWIQERIDAGKLSVHAWKFDLSTGIIHQFDAATNRFTELQALQP
jgi:carbonic anhydrase